MAKIGYDFRAIASPQKSGVEKYILQVADLVPKEMPSDTFYLFVDANARSGMYTHFIRGNVRIIRLPVTGEKKFWFLVKLLTQLLKIELFHFPLGIMPVELSCKTIINIHDLTYEKRPDFYEDWEVDLQKTLVPKAARECNRILTISKATSLDIQKFYNIKPNKITVIYPPIDKAIENQVEFVSSKKEKYFIAIGNVQPRKNFPKIVESLKYLDGNISLYIIGKIQDKDEEALIKKVIHENNLEQRVRVTGYLADAELKEIYKHAVGLVFASIYEGFGYPIVEAFKAGLPVITSRGSSTEEVAGGAAIIVDPSSERQIADAMKLLLSSATTRREYIAKGLARSKELSRVDFGKEVAAVYRGVLDEK